MTSKKNHILVAPLDWGIGHATRCVPVIRMLLQKGVDVTVAAGGQPLAFLKLSFPEVSFLRSESFRVHYPGNGSMALKMALATPGFLMNIYEEHKWLEGLIDEYDIDAVISDNRFGFWSSKVPSIYLTHQVVIKMPSKLSALEPLTYRAHGQFIRKYSECWIPDMEGELNLSGDLSHKYTKPRNASFIGPLSRFSEFARLPGMEAAKDAFDLLVLLSGPEPQRSILEKKVRDLAVKKPELKVALLQGLPGDSLRSDIQDRLTVYSHLPDHRIASLVRNARAILCRPGYSTIMDLVSMKKTAILVPTPGQTEQEYLGKYLSEKKWFHCIRRGDLNIDRVLKAVAMVTSPLPELPAEGLLEGKIDELIERLMDKSF